MSPDFRSQSHINGHRRPRGRPCGARPTVLVSQWHGRPTAQLAFPRRPGARVEACDADRLYSFRTLNLKNPQRLMQPELEQTRREPVVVRDRQITTPRIEHFINGRRFAGSSKREMDVFNPATGEETARVAMASSADVEEAERAEPTCLSAMSMQLDATNVRGFS